MSTRDFGPDALFQIAEPGPVRPATRRPGLGIGVDLGTTHSLVAIAPLGAAPTVLEADEEGALLDSVVSYQRDGRVLVGRAARARFEHEPTRTIVSVKRFLGRGRDELGFAHPYQLEGGRPGQALRFRIDEGCAPTGPEVSARILGVLVARAERALGARPDGAVITVPAYFDDAQRQATRDAGRLAGLEVWRLLAEPTAAALAYGLERRQQGLFAVYDLGGGTFDFSVLELRQGVFRVLAVAGDSALGGDDFDRLVLREAFGDDWARAASAEQRAAAAVAARRCKERLTTAEVASLEVPGLGARELTRARFEAAIAELLARTLRLAKDALRQAERTAGELDGVVMVGGSTRIPAVVDAVRRGLGHEPLRDLDPDRVVAMGAAIQADALSGSARPGFVLLDVVPLTLGVETMGGVVEKLIPRNAPIPSAARQVFTNHSEHQTAMKIHVVQGERELAADCRSLARFELTGIPKLAPGMARVEISFQVDADGLLTVSARELMTGQAQRVEVQPTWGLSRAEVDELVEASERFAAADFAARDRAEALVEAERAATTVTRLLEQPWQGPGSMSREERERCAAALAELGRVVADPASPRAAIEQARAALERVSEPLVRRRLELALAHGIGGTRLDELEAALPDEATLEPRRGGHGAGRAYGAGGPEEGP